MTTQGYASHEHGQLGQGSGSSRSGQLVRAVIGRSRVAQSVVKSRPVQRQIWTGRALTVVRGRARFVAEQLVGSRTGRYELRDCGLTVHIRPYSEDLVILNKIFARDASRNSYDPPPEIAAALDASRAPRILDVGANIGIFGVFALSRWPTMQMTSFEPEPSNRQVLQQTASANASGLQWAIVGAAVANAPGELRFVPGLGAKAHIAETHEDATITVPKVDIFEQQGDGVDLIKMDIEGGEWAILADPRFSLLKTPAIRLEWHTLHCPQPDARAEAIRLLRAGGFSHIVDADHEHDRNGVLWAWRDALSA